MFRLNPAETAKVVNYMHSDIERAERGVIVSFKDGEFDLTIREKIFYKDGSKFEHKAISEWEPCEGDVSPQLEDNGDLETEFISIVGGVMTLYEEDNSGWRGDEIGIYEGRYVDIVRQIAPCILGQSYIPTIKSRLKELEKKEPMFTFCEK